MRPNNIIPKAISRRTLMAGGAVAGAAMLGQAKAADAKSAAPKPKVAIFSKHLLFLQGDDLAKGAAEIGFDGIDLAVRKGGHVDPERVRQDLPPLVAVIRKQGLEVPMLTTDIVDIETPHTEDMLKTMADLNIRYYRWGGLKYEGSQSYATQLEAMKPRIAKLAAMNARYKTNAIFHTHSGVGVVGASIWDLYILLKDFDPTSVAVNYDIGHATVEGGFGGWINSFNICGPYLRGVAVKDFLWAKNARGAWAPAWKPLGEGMVRLPQFFSMLAKTNFNGPMQLHFEYPLAGADTGKTKLSGGSRDEVFTAMKRDLGKLRSYLSDAYGG
jgi:sugar phosphate isomerase/epimerase